MNDRIVLKNMVFFGYHGCQDYEKTVGQRFQADVLVLTDFSRAASSDCLADAVDYTAVWALTREHLENRRCNLLETVCVRLAENLLDLPGVLQAEVTVRKPGAPVAGALDAVEMTAVRRR